jgi:PAS domain S-box-containing protein
MPIRQELLKELERRTRFETLLADLSEHFITSSSGCLDTDIEFAQAAVCEFFDLDRSTLWQVADRDNGALLLTHFYQPPDSPGLWIVKQMNSDEARDSKWVIANGETPPAPILADADAFFPWTTKQLRRGEPVIISSLDDLPPDAAHDREVLDRYRTKSTVVLPLRVGEVINGAISFAMVREEREWTKGMLHKLHLLSMLFAGALERRRADLTLRESWQRLNLAADSALAALWTMDLNTGAVWTTATARKMLGVPADAELDFEGFLAVVHPEDRQKVRRSLEQIARTRESFQQDYRIVLSDSTIRWLTARGRTQFDSYGKPCRLMGVSLDITESRLMEEQLQERVKEVEQLKQRLELENIYLQEEIKGLITHGGIIGQSPAMKRVVAQAMQVAPTDSTVLIQGETGTGKELLARAIHEMSPRKDRPLVTVNCASLPPTLIESELFGREKGAYTGALTRMIGRFELADGSSIFLDEIGELPVEIQSKLLRILEEGTFERVGSTTPIRVNLRIIAATNRNLEKEVEKGSFRKDLFYRLNVFPIEVPPLRVRPEDIPQLTRAFVMEFCEKMRKKIERIPEKSMSLLKAYPWPGNVRELRNIIERAVIVSRGRDLELIMPETASGHQEPRGRTLEDLERTHILSVLERSCWRISGAGGAAQTLGLKRTTLLSKMKKLGISRTTRLV